MPRLHKTTIIPYTNEQWMALRKITRMFRAMRNRLLSIKEDGKFSEFLLGVFAKDAPLLLPSPKENK